MGHVKPAKLGAKGLMLVLLLLAAPAAQAQLPPLCVEITPDHPLFIFQVPEAGDVAYARHVADAWANLPEELKPFAMLQVSRAGAEFSARHSGFRALLSELQTAGIPVVIRIADGDPKGMYPLAPAEELLRDFTCVKGVQVVQLAFEEYYPFGGGAELGLPPNVRWLIGAIDLAARYGRFIAIQLDRLRWPRVMSNGWCRPLYEKMVKSRAYVVPIFEYRGAHTVTQQASLMGLWLEGAVNQWGVGAQSLWYGDAAFVEPGVFGPSDGPSKMPSPLYRAMVLNGAMAGATVYSFEPGSDLWFGNQRRHWEQAIYPTLKEIIEQDLIPRKDMVKSKAKVAYQLAPAWTAQDFHLNLRDIDGVLDKGFLIHGAYGMERPGQVAELILNSGRHYWVPVLSPYAPAELLDSFQEVVQAGVMTSAQTWTELLDRCYVPDGSGTAFASRVGRGIFVMHTRENLYEEQTFRIPQVPAPVRQIQVRLNDNVVTLTWPFREGDVAYSVYKRVGRAPYALIASDVDEQRYVDAAGDLSTPVAYSVTALTNEHEPYEGTVNFGDYLALSTVESRIAEEVVIGTLLVSGKSRPIEPAASTGPPSQTWWPNLSGLTETQLPVAQAIAGRIEAWDEAFTQENLDGVLALYDTDYQDPEGWQCQYVRRAYQWFFERYEACRMSRQIRCWDFSAFENSHRARVLLYCRFSGVAISDPEGRTADVQAHSPRTESGEVWLTFAERDGRWHIISTDPALPNFKDILSFSAGPYDRFSVGADVWSL